MERYVLQGGCAGYGRLRVLARTHQAGTVGLLHWAGVSPGMRCLDLGCGGGDVSFQLAALAGPAGTVTGIDMDEVTLGLARDAARARGIGNVEFRPGNVADWDEPASYDFVYCRFLLQHLSQPAALLRRMWAAVRGGGVLAVEDTDFDGCFCEPRNAGFEFYRDAYQRVVAHHGGDTRIGRALYRLFLAAGIPSPQVRVVQEVHPAGEGKTLPLLTLQATAERIVQAGLAGREEVSAALRDLTACIADPVTIISGPRVLQVWARRPTEPTPPGGRPQDPA